MIYTNSIVDGFKVIIGAFPIHFAMFGALIFTIRIPRDDNGDRNDKATFLYCFMTFNHMLLGVTSAFNTVLEVPLKSRNMGHVCLSEFNIVAMCGSLCNILLISNQWVFNDSIVGVKEMNADWELFTFWTVIELLVFTSTIFCNMIWLFCRSLCRNTTDLEPFAGLLN